MTKKGVKKKKSKPLIVVAQEEIRHVDIIDNPGGITWIDDEKNILRVEVFSGVHVFIDPNAEGTTQAK